MPTFFVLRWSRRDLQAAFWRSIADFFEVRFHAKPRAAITDRNMPGTKWFEGATLNYAEAALARRDGATAIVHRREDGLTRAMILHPIACGLAFIAFLTSLGAGVIGSILGAMIAAVAWLVTLIVMAIDFTLFGVCLIDRHIPMNPSFHHALFEIPD